jgi:hypothetical protein
MVTSRKSAGKAAGKSKPAKKKAEARPAHPPGKAVAKPPAKDQKPAAKPSAAPPPAARAMAVPLPAAGKGAAPARPGAAVPGAKPGGKPVRPGGDGGPRPIPSPRSASPRKGGRKSSLASRRGPNGEPFVPGDLLLPTGPQGPDEIQYLLRGSVAAEHAAGPSGVSEIILKKGTPEAEADRGELTRYAEGMSERFEKGSIEPLLPSRAPARRNFAGVVERAKHRRREIGAFLRGLDLGRTETSHMDSHGEASLQSLMEWAARLENLAEADEPDQADYAQFHRGLDQLENTTEALIVDVELTLRRLRDRVRS